MPTTTLGLPYPDPDDDNDVPAHLQALALSVNELLPQLIEAGVPPLIAEQIVNANPQIAAQAAALAQSDAGLVRKTDSGIPAASQSPELAWHIKDLYGRAPLGVDLEGVTQAFGGINAAGLETVRMPAATGYAVAVMDSNRRAVFAIRLDGTVDLALSADTIARLAQEGLTRTDPRADGGADLVLILGQSNAQGAGQPFNADEDITFDGLNQYAGSGPNVDTVIPAEESLFHVTRYGDRSVGPGMEFGRQFWLAQPNNRTTLLVPAALGSTSIHGPDANFTNYTWDPTKTAGDVTNPAFIPGPTGFVNLYTRAIAKTQAALALHPANRLAAILWVQGESDSLYMTRSAYAAKLGQIIDGLRTTFGLVPFIVGGSPPPWVAGDAPYTAIRDAQLDAVATRDLAGFAHGPGPYNVSDPAGVTQDGALHYNAKGARLLGRSMYATYRQITGA